MDQTTRKSFAEIQLDRSQQEIFNYKWKDGFVCRVCLSNITMNVKGLYDKRCGKCKTIHSLRAGTVFHNGRIPLPTALFIIKRMVQSDQRLHSTDIKQLGKFVFGDSIIYIAREGSLKAAIVYNKETKNSDSEFLKKIIKDTALANKNISEKLVRHQEKKIVLLDTSDDCVIEIESWLQGVKKTGNFQNIQAYLNFLMFKLNQGTYEELMLILTRRGLSKVRK